MSDPKARKVIVLENTFLPQFVKEQIAKALFENLKVSRRSTGDTLYYFCRGLR